MRIDFHTHCFPDKIAAKAVDKLSFASGGLIPHTDGTVTGLRTSMAAGGVDASVVLSIATNAHQQKSVNDFAASINNGQDVFAFGSVFPDAEDALDELERIKALGLKGVKLHPDYQGFFVDDPKMKPIYQKISSLGLITVFHAGSDYGFPPPYGGTPERMATALSWFDAPVVAAHWGGVNYNEDVLELLCGRDIYATEIVRRKDPGKARHRPDAVRHRYPVAYRRTGAAAAQHAGVKRRRYGKDHRRQRQAAFGDRVNLHGGIKENSLMPPFIYCSSFWIA